MSHRKEQVESMLIRVISQVLVRDMSDPRLLGMISVTQVDVSPDLRHAKVFVSVMPEKYEKRTLAALQHATRHVHAKVSKHVALRMVPHLNFCIDPSLKKQAMIEAAIHRGMDREGEEVSILPTLLERPPEKSQEKSPKTLREGVGVGQAEAEVAGNVGGAQEERREAGIGGECRLSAPEDDGDLK